MYKPESVQENQMLKIIWAFEIQTDYLIHVRGLELLMIIKKKQKKRENLL